MNRRTAVITASTVLALVGATGTAAALSGSSGSDEPVHLEHSTSGDARTDPDNPALVPETDPD
jgi:hypothetical protein